MLELMGGLLESKKILFKALKMQLFYIIIGCHEFWIVNEQGAWGLGQGHKYHIVFTFFHDTMWQRKTVGILLNN